MKATSKLRPPHPVACLGGGVGCSSTPLAQAVQYIIEASGSSPASPWFSKRDHFFSKYYAWHGTSKYFVGTVTWHRGVRHGPLRRTRFPDFVISVVDCLISPNDWRFLGGRLLYGIRSASVISADFSVIS